MPSKSSEEQCGPESLAMRLLTHRKGGQTRSEDSVGGTPTAAVETTALPKKSLMIEDSGEV
jgi:hypothetical protein